MSDIVIRVENLSKQYRIGGPQGRYKTIRESLTEAVQAPFRRLSSVVRGQSSAVSNETIWALKDVSFEVKRGEVVGIIGRNGAGKTTLLKVLSRITEPTEGYAEIHGRVGSLLEVGTGFHPELTGRENIYLNGAILGMKKAEVEGKFDEIVDFADVEKFIDTPVKHYSSGMRMRLAFSVAAHLEPEIMLIDEVLAVGDIEFQKKCLGKMKDVTDEGRTVLFVSHNMSMIQTLCPESLLLASGFLQMRGPSSKVVETYLKDKTAGNGEYTWNYPDESFDNLGPFVPLSLRILDHQSQATDRLFSKYPFQVEFRYRLTRKTSNLYVGLSLRTIHGEQVCISYDQDKPDSQDYVREPGVYITRCTIPGNLLNDGNFVLGVLAGIKRVQIFYRDFELIQFSVDIAGGVGAHLARWGVVRPYFEWSTSVAE
jgi:lipopolysaccharide transport system ATP-binding protein